MRFIEAKSLPERVILTDDPMRVKMMAAHHLQNAEVLDVGRGMVVFTGSYGGVPVALISCGFGAVAAEIYLREAAELGAKTVVYTGECVSKTRELGLREVVLVGGGDETLAQAALAQAEKLGFRAHLREVFTNERFLLDGLSQGAILDFATEAVYRCARERGLRALSVLTVSENTATNESVEEHERQSRFHNAVRLVFETIAAN